MQPYRATREAECAGGEAIPIELRDPREVTHLRGRGPDGRVVEVQLTPDGVTALNPAFDVTPARLVTALVTEHGCIDASAEAIAALLARRAEGRT